MMKFEEDFTKTAKNDQITLKRRKNEVSPSNIRLEADFRLKPHKNPRF